MLGLSVVGVLVAGAVIFLGGLLMGAGYPLVSVIVLLVGVIGTRILLPFVPESTDEPVS